MIMHIILTIMLIVFTIASSVNMDCYWDSDYVNNWDGDHNSIKRTYYFAGMDSVHSNHHGDRRFKWRYCKPQLSEPSIGPFTGSLTREMSETDYDEEWTRSCKNFNSGDAAIHGIESSHGNYYGDRKWTIKCGLLDRNQYKLSNCRWNYYGNMGGWDDEIDYQCPNNGVLRSIRSRHWNHAGDRQFRVECCTIAEQDYSFDGITGYWNLISDCNGCTTSHTVEYGISRETGREATTTFETGLSVAVSLGFEAEFVSGSVTVEASIAQSISNSMSESFSQHKIVSDTRHCEKRKFYQWIMEATESSPLGTSTVTIPSLIFFCTDDLDYPECLPDDCQTSPDNDNDNGINLPDIDDIVPDIDEIVPNLPGF